MSDPKPLAQRLDDSLFLGPPPSLGAPARAAGSVADSAPDEAPPASGRAPWWSAAAEAARVPVLPTQPKPAPRPPAPAPAPAAAETTPSPAADAPWWSPARARRALPAERPRATRPAAMRPIRLAGTRPSIAAPVEPPAPPRVPWWNAAAKAERSRPAGSAPAAPPQAPALPPEGAPWYARPPRRAPKPTGRRVRVSAAPESSESAPWWSEAAWDVRPLPAAKESALPAPRRTAVTPRTPAAPPPAPGLAPEDAPWYARSSRRTAKPTGRRVRVSAAFGSSESAPWWSEAAWDVRPLPAAKESARPVPPRTDATPRAPADRTPGGGSRPAPSPEDGRAPVTRAPSRAGNGIATPLLSVRDLTVAFRGNPVVRGVTFDVMPGETVALVGESGSGKSVTALSCLRLLGPGGTNPAGRITLDGVDVLIAPEADLQRLRGGVAGMVFQEPMTSLNPLHTVGRQVEEAVTLHRPLRGPALRERVLELLRRAGLGAAAERLDAYPHQLSGGQRQRVMIAVALANDPRLLIADEPTTALDVTIQAQVLELLARLKRELGMAMLLITHDLAIVRRHADRVVVMKDGEAMEAGDVATVFANPAHPYTRLLIETQPHGRAAPLPPDAPELLRATDVKVHFPIRRGLLRRTVAHVKAVDGVSLSLRRGETLGVVGESGSGKTTLGLTLLQLERGEGAVTLDGRRIEGLSRAELRPLRRRMQVVFQDPYGSLSPRMSVAEIVAEGLAVHEPDLSRPDRDARVAAALREVNLDPGTAVRYPHEFSGGQRQRIAIARALVLSPDLVVLDEPTSALDVSVQAQVVDLLRDLQARRGLAYLFISHDLRVVRALSHRIMVMKDGVVVEEGETEAVVANPTQPYTRALMAAAFDLRADGATDPRAYGATEPRAYGATEPRADGATEPHAEAAPDAPPALPDVAADPAPLVPGAVPTRITSAVLSTPADTPAARAPDRGP